MYKKVMVIFAIIFNFFNVFASEAYLSYEVQKGDSLGKILHEMNYTPLWGSNGFVKKTIDLNKGQLSDGGDIIVVGAVIKLPLKTETLVISKSIASVETVIDSPSKIKSYLFLSLGGLLNEIESVDKSSNGVARVETKFSQQYGVGLASQWDDNKWFHIGFTKTSMEFKQPVKRKIENQKQSYSSLLVGGTYAIGRTTSFGLGYGISETPYLRATDQSTLKVESPWIHKLILTIDQKILVRENADISIGVKAYVLMKKEIEEMELENGKGAIFEIKNRQRVFGLDLEALLFYEISKQNTDILKQTTKANGIKFSLLIPMGN